MAEEQENMQIQLQAPIALDDDSFKKLMKQDLEQNSQPYLAEVATRHKLDLNKEHAKVLEKAYDEQVNLISEQSSAFPMRWMKIQLLHILCCKKYVIFPKKMLRI